MTPEELAALLEDIVLDAESRYVKAITRLQNSLYSDLVAIYKDLELDTLGNIKQSAANRKVLTEADKTVQSVFRSREYINSVTSYVAAIPKIDKTIGDYFASVSSSYKPNRVFLKDLQYDAIKNVEQYILRDGLQSQVIGPLQQIMTQNVNTGGKFTDFMDQLKVFIKGDNQVEGRALRYTRTYLKDTLFTYARTYQEAATSDLGMEFYYYAGGRIDTTREFCLERMGQYYHREEVKQWAQLSWSGKKADTTESSIFVYAGGWNCGHQLVPVSDAMVPAEVLQRVEDAGIKKGK